MEVGLRGFRSRLDLTVRSGLSAGRPPVTRSEQGDHKEHDSHRDDRNPHPHGDDMVLGPRLLTTRDGARFECPVSSGEMTSPSSSNFHDSISSRESGRDLCFASDAVTVGESAR